MRAEYEIDNTGNHCMQYALVALGIALIVLMITFPRPFLISGPAVYTALLLASAALTAVVLGTRPARQMARSVPHLVIDGDGLHPLAFGIPTMAWEDIRRICIKHRIPNPGHSDVKQHYLCIDFHQAETASRIHQHIRKRRISSAYILIAPSRISIDFSKMRPNIEDACRIIEQICAARQQSGWQSPLLELTLPGRELQIR